MPTPPLLQTNHCSPQGTNRGQDKPGQTGRYPIFRRTGNWGTSRLYECISEMKKGSASGYDAEAGEESADSESSLGEPYECP